MVKARAKKEGLGRNHSARSRTPLSSFARRLFREWRRLELPQAREGLIIGVSGGADSVALLLGMDELCRAGKTDLKIVVAHLNHKLRGAASDADSRWVASLARRLGYRAVVKAADVKKRAQKSKDNLEQAARRARYEFLAGVARAQQAKLIVTAHTMNDQAETILLNLIRGSGSDGLSGIEPRRPLAPESDILLARPLVTWARRKDTENFCRARLIEYRQDEMNFDVSFNRVRVRKELLPLFEEFNPRFIENLTRSAELFRQDSVALNLAAVDLLDRDGTSSGPQPLRTAALRDVSVGLRRRALRLWLAQHRGSLRRIEHAHIVAIERLLLSEKSGRKVELPGGDSAFRRNGRLHYRPRSSAK